MTKKDEKRRQIRLPNRRGKKVRPTHSNQRRRKAPAPPPRDTPTSIAAAGGAGLNTFNNVSYTEAVPHTQLRTMRKERRDLMQKLAETERRADDAERSLVHQLAEAESRLKTAEKEINDAKLRVEAAEKKRDDVIADQSAFYDEGTELWQNHWDHEGVSTALKFPTYKSVVCDSHHIVGGNSMPGVHAAGAIDNGRTTQSIWLKGHGYSLVGLVTSEDQKNALRQHAGNDYTKMPLMTPFYHSGGDNNKGEVFTIEIDMMERRAELYLSDSLSKGHLEPHIVWENLLVKVWVAVAFKRNSGREAVLMPCIHWNIQDGTHS